MKQNLGVYGAPQSHWVGDGFPVRTLFSYDSLGKHVSPFLLLDYAGPADFGPAQRLRGVGQHPHRGFETVTIVYQGELQHRDSAGNGGLIGPGDVQWMTAAAGILHEEFHSEAFTRTGGTLEMVQLWVNLPARDKSAAPGYQTLLASDIPQLPLGNNAGTLRLIAGEFAGRRGPARTFTPMDVWDMRLIAGKQVALDVREGRNAVLLVLRGSVRMNGSAPVVAGEFALFDRAGAGLLLEADSDAAVLLLSGDAIDEPLVGRGPFVMNSEAELAQAFRDYRNGAFGEMSGRPHDN